MLIVVWLIFARVYRQGRSNGLKGGGTLTFRLAPSALAWTSRGTFSAKIFSVVFLRVEVKKRDPFANIQLFRQNEVYLSVFRAPTAKSRNFREF